MGDRIYRTSGKWGLSSDTLQWILVRRHGEGWDNLSFVSSSKDILARCMREKGVPADDAAVLLAGLPPTFAEWKDQQ